MSSVHWKTGTSGDWSTAANWVGGIVPGAGDEADFSGTSAYGVTLSQSVAVGSIAFHDPAATLSITGTLDLGGALTIEQGTMLVEPNAVISGGTISAPQGAIQWRQGSVSGVTYEGTLAVGSGESLNVEDGLTVVQANGDPGGTIELSGGLVFDGAITLSAMTLDAGSGAVIEFSPTSPDSSRVFTLASDTELDAGAGSVLVLALGALINDGSIVVEDGADLQLGQLIEYPAEPSTSLYNNGSMTIESGGDLAVGAELLANRVQLDGGAVRVESNSTLTFQGQVLRVIDAPLILDGPGSAVQSAPAPSYAEPMETTLEKIIAGGALEILSGRGFDYSYAPSLIEDGLLEIGGGTFTGGLTIGKGATVSGFGVVDGAIANAGSVVATGGTLTLQGPVTKTTGVLLIEASATLAVEAAASSALTFAGTGATLALSDPSEFSGRIAAFGPSDTIDLVDLVATSAKRVTGNQLQVFDGADLVATLALTGSYAGAAFHVASDGQGGSAITVTTASAARNLAQASAAFAPSPTAGDAADIFSPRDPRIEMLAASRSMRA